MMKKLVLDRRPAGAGLSLIAANPVPRWCQELVSPNIVDDIGTLYEGGEGNMA